MYIVMTVMSAVFLVIGAAVLRLLKMYQHQAERIRTLQNQLSALCSGASGTDNRILQFEKTLSKMKDQQQTLELSSHNGSARAYDHAIRLARKGAGVEQLIDNCNLSDEEAHLISRLHGDMREPLNMH
jgi:L-asparaginase II